jgi:hypothetical protein
VKLLVTHPHEERALVALSRFVTSLDWSIELLKVVLHHESADSFGSAVPEAETKDFDTGVFLLCADLVLARVALAR